MRVFIATSVAVYELGLVQVLGSYPAIEIVGSARTAAATVAAVDALRPDLVLLDVSLPRAMDALRALRDPARRLPVLGLAVGDDGDALVCMEAGIAGCVPRDASLPELVEAMWSTLRGEALCSPRLAGALIRRVADLAERGGGAADDSAVLTAREREIVVLIDRGLSNKQIAQQLGIELATVKNHVHHVLAKLSVGRRSEAAARARQVLLPSPIGAPRLRSSSERG